VEVAVAHQTAGARPATARAAAIGGLADVLRAATPTTAAALLRNAGSHDRAPNEVHDATLRLLLRLAVDSWAEELGLVAPHRPAPPSWARAIAIPDDARASVVDAVTAIVDGSGQRGDPAVLGDAYAAQLGATAVIDGDRLVLRDRLGNRRRTAGAFHTPPPLVELLVELAVPPLLAQARNASEVLALRVCDPAAGGGALLLAAARRLADRIVALDVSTDIAHDKAFSSVIASCLRGADRDPLAAELTRIALWLGAADPSLPLAELDDHIVVGDGLLGTSLDGSGPPVRADGSRRAGPVLPATALRSRPHEGRKLLPALRQRSRATPRAGVAAPLRTVQERLVADAWCAAWTGTRDAATALAPYDVLDAIGAGETPPAEAVAAVTAEAARTGPLHWHLAFPDIAAAGGFDLVLANPPWERLRLQQKRWFARMDRLDVAEAPSAAVRRERIAALDDGNAVDRTLAASWRDAQRDAHARASFLRDSGCFPLTGRGDVNAYAVFAERCLQLTSPHGRTALIAPNGLLTDLGTAAIPRLLVDGDRLTDVIGFRDAGQHFGSVGSVPFAVLAASGSAGAHDPTVRLASGLGEVAGWEDASFRIDRTALVACNPDSRTLVPARSRADLELAVRLHLSHPVLQPTVASGDAGDAGDAGDRWSLRFVRPFDMTNDAHLFSSDPVGRVPLLEGKLVGLHDHRAHRMTGPTTRALDLEAAADPARPVGALRFVAPDDVARRTPAGDVLLVVRLINGRATSRTLVAALAPRLAVGNSLAVIDADPRQRLLLAGLLCSLPLDHVLRTKIEDANVNLFVLRQLPIPALHALMMPAPWDPSCSIGSWIAQRVAALAAASAPVAHGLGLPGSITVDAATRRAWRDDLDAAAFHLYGHTRDEVEHVLSTFAGLTRIESAAGTPNRTLQAVLARLDQRGSGHTQDSDAALPELPSALATPLTVPSPKALHRAGCNI
jgi:hypothetical protein